MPFEFHLNEPERWLEGFEFSFKVCMERDEH